MRGVHVCHTCDVRRCINPDHLWAGTHKLNQEDKVAKGRHIKGNAVHTAKLTDTDVALIRYLHECGVTQKNLRALYGLSTGNISYLVRGKTWKHVKPLEGPHAES